MTQHQDFLFELGCEELPPTSLATLAEALYVHVTSALSEQGLTHDLSRSRWMATPRRLALVLADLLLQQPDRVLVVEGPPLSACFSTDGKPTPAALGFARKQGVQVDDLERGADRLRLQKRISGKSARELLPELMAQALADLPIAKRMRWGSRREEFVRPVHSLVMLLGEEVIPATLLGLKSGRTLLGHRFMAPGPWTLHHARDYAGLMLQAKVMVDFDERRQLILQQVRKLETSLGGMAIVDESLLDEVTALVEWPVALHGSFDPRFLQVPQEALISTMQGNQKYFPLVDHEGGLLPHFIFISNLESPRPDLIVAGNERVVRPRLTDAEFFFAQDRKLSLAEHDQANAHVVYQARLGSLQDKAHRHARLAAWIATTLGADAVLAEQAGMLSRADLATLMVSEFPDLQGIMGRHYARHEGLPMEVAEALFEQYLPRYAGDKLPITRSGIALALADKLDTLTGIFGVGQVPTGSADPFALRRAALGVLRIIIEHALPLQLNTLIDHALAGHQAQGLAPQTASALLEFFTARYRAYYEDRGIGPDFLQAVLNSGIHSPIDVDRRVRALHEFRHHPNLAALVAANKRVAKLLDKEGLDQQREVLSDLLLEDSERQLHLQLLACQPYLLAASKAGQYEVLLERLADLRPAIDRFFTDVMVMTDDM
ncbi:MAG: glycine--tRNA ligase subunit beta, partial [Pseudomonadales bacterium]|nr:glycine--tRNA ligase subunit beta [Pseudomonadales bacterium]